MHFRDKPGFDDDDLFSPTRFALVFAYHQARLPHDMSVMQAAGLQVERMLSG